MDELDKRISETLDDEDREILDRIGREQSYSELALDLFRGRLGWLNGAIFFWQIIFFGAGIYAAWQFFTLAEELDVIRWGISAAVLLLAALITKIAIFPAMQANRVLRALKHLEMQIALLGAKR